MDERTLEIKEEKRLDITGCINDFYDVFVHYQAHFVDKEKIIIGKDKKCRYCSNTEPTNFSNTAHTIPEFLGNKAITSLDECDNCNKIFSKYESELSVFLNPYLAMGKIRGKNGIPKIKGYGFELKRDAERKINVSVSNKEPQDVISYNFHTDTIQLKAEMPNHKFIPRYAYKALCKMALSILPIEELEHFKKLIEWILKPDDSENFHYLGCKISQTHLLYYLPCFGAYILKRRNNSVNVPYMIFVLMAGTFCLQIDVMSDEKDNHIDLFDDRDIHIRKNLILRSGDRQFPINYEGEVSMNWAGFEKANILLNSVGFNIPRTLFSKQT